MLTKLSSLLRCGRHRKSFRWLWLFTVLLLVGNSSAWAQTNQGTTQVIRTILPSEWDVPYPAGVAYSTDLVQLFLLGKNTVEPPATGSTIVAITPYEQLIGTVNLDFAVDDAINITFADQGKRLFLLNHQRAQLAQVQIGASGLLDPATLAPFDIAWFGLTNPQGMSVDASSGQLFILDSTPPRVIRVTLTPDSGFDQTQISIINLAQLGVATLRGIAVHPLNHHLYVGSPTENKLYELTQAGKLVTSYDLAPLTLVDPRGLVFAPSADLTDPPDRIDLLAADSNLPDSQQPLTLTANLLKDGQVYLPMVSQHGDQRMIADVARPSQLHASVFGKVVEARLDCSACLLPTQTITVAVTSGTDDAEEQSNGWNYLDSTDLELTRDINTQQIVGVRFTGVAIPASATIINAYIEFATDETSDEPTALTLHGEATADAAPFAETSYNLSSRRMTTAGVSWPDIPAWGLVQEKHQTPNLAPIVQEIVNGSGWQSGHALAFILTGTGRRVAQAYDGNPAGAPRLVIEYRPLE